MKTTKTKTTTVGGSDLIWQSGVIRGRDGRVWLEFDDPAACSRCSQGSGCGAALFSQLFPRPRLEIPLGQCGPLQPGQRVRAGLSAHWLLAAAAALYLLPVLSFLAGCVVAGAIWPANDLAALCGGVLVAVLAAPSIRRRLGDRRPPELELVKVDGTLESVRDGDHVPSHDA